MLIEGKWASDWHPVQAKDKTGRFLRQKSSFRNWITPDGSAGPTGTDGFKAEAGRYRLYVAYICPWASRTLMARTIKGLEDVLPVTIVNPTLTDQGWAFGNFEGADRDPLHNSKYMHELYTHADPEFTGRATVPVLWDTKRDVMVNNESADILRMLNTAFSGLVDDTVDLYPGTLADDIDALTPRVYRNLNNGVYQAGFASSQQAYDEAVQNVFATLDALEQRFSDGRQYLIGNQMTEADIRTFVTLIRFDVAYHGLFKTNLKRIADYPLLQAYMERILMFPGVAGTVNLNHIKTGYYSIKALNPSQIVPQGPEYIERLVTKAQSK